MFQPQFSHLSKAGFIRIVHSKVPSSLTCLNGLFPSLYCFRTSTLRVLVLLTKGAPSPNASCPFELVTCLSPHSASPTSILIWLGFLSDQPSLSSSTPLNLDLSPAFARTQLYRAIHSTRLTAVCHWVAKLRHLLYLLQVIGSQDLKPGGATRLVPVLPLDQTLVMVMVTLC